MTVCTRAFLAFFARNRRLFDQDALEPICESITGDDDVTVTLTAPYGEETLFGPEALFELDDPPPVTATARPAVGRNDPCPCGSGKKFKKCCG
jgi:preprotein translocase subunit SecA